MMKLTCVDSFGEIRQSISAKSVEDALESVPQGLFGVGYGPEGVSSWYSFELEQWFEKGEKPYDFCEWDKTTKTWFDPRTLDFAKEEKWAEIKLAREAAINADLVTPFGTFDSDAKSRTNITDSVLLLKSLDDVGTHSTIDFTLSDDSVVTLNTEQMVQVGLLLGQKVQAAHTRSRALRIQKDAATTKEEVAAIVW